MTTLPVWRVTNGWREIFARIFENVTTQFNVTPEWLVNPATNRRLKLDLLYPELHVAVRFEGLQGQKRRRRLSLEEEAQLQVRQDARVEVCRQHGIHLVVVNVATGQPPRVFQQLDVALSRTKAGLPDPALRQQITRARSLITSLSVRVRTLEDLKLYADLWADRQYQLSEPAEAPAAPPSAVTFTAGMEVEHTAFGPGVVISTAPSNGDTLITVDFITAGQKTLAASLVAGKLLPR